MVSSPQPGVSADREEAIPVRRSPRGDANGRTCHLHDLPRRLLADLLSSSPLAPPANGGPLLSILTDVDWHLVAQEANRHTIGVLLLTRLDELALTHVLPADVARAWEADRRHARLQHLLQLRDALAISAAFTDAGITHAFMKGFAYRTFLYAPAWVRIGGDVDVLIDRAQIPAARTLMHDLGFIQARFLPDHQRFWTASSAEIKEAEDAHHELAEFNKDHILENAPEWLLVPPFERRTPFAYAFRGAEPVMRSSVDVHWALHLLLADFDPLARRHVVEVAGTRLPVLGREWSLIMSAFKLYFEAFDRPRFGLTHIADLVALCTSTEDIDWSLVSEVVARTGLEAALFYTLGACERVVSGALAPARLMDAWAAIGEEASLPLGAANLDFGDFLPYLVGTRTAGALGRA